MWALVVFNLAISNPSAHVLASYQNTESCEERRIELMSKLTSRDIGKLRFVCTVRS